VHRLLEDVGKRNAALQAWLGDAAITPRFRTALDKALSD
jgi:hypothetical protein